MNRAEIIDKCNQAFADCPRPVHFTNHTHCEECADHDTVLRSFNRETIGLEQLGNPGWDPICFVTPEGFLYYAPSLVRLALVPSEESYLDQFLFHMTYEDLESRFFRHFNLLQCQSILCALGYIESNMADLVLEWRLEKELQNALNLWTTLSRNLSK